jgi:hypothetical protein
VHPRHITWVFLALFAFFAACGDNIKAVREDGSVRRDMALGSAKTLTSYTFKTEHNPGLANGVDGTINGTTITATVPFGTNVTALVADFATTGESVKVGGTEQVSGTTANDFSGPVTYTVTAADGSQQIYTVNVTIAPAGAKDLTSFSFLDADNTALTADVDGVISGTDISVTVPFDTNVTALVATFATTGASVKVGSTVQVSGTTANNFTSAVDYIVTASDGTTQTYTVTVTIAANTAKEITAFSFESSKNPGLASTVIAAVGSGSITATVPFGTDVSDLVATFTTTGASVKVGATEQMSGITHNSFSSPVNYIVTAADGTMQTYTVTVNIAADTSADIIAFRFRATLNSTVLSFDAIGNITGTNITVVVPKDTVISDLIATYSTSGASVTVGGAAQTSGATHNDFSSPVQYVVTAADGVTTKTYTVTVNNSNATDKTIDSFEIDGVLGNISGTTITLTLPAGTDLSARIPTIGFTGNSVSPGSGVANDFRTPATYTVTAADTSTATYTVIVSLAGDSDKDITSFVINGFSAQIADINATSGVINLTLPKGTILTNLIPDIEITGQSVSPDNGVAQDFTNSVTYTVTAKDGSMKTYTVNVDTVSGNGTKLITSFVILGISGQISNASPTGSVTLTLPAGNSPIQTPTIVINGSSLTPPSRVPQNFTNPVTYTVTDSTGATHEYIVTVTILP